MASLAGSARDLARRSQAAVRAKDRTAWLSLFAPDAIVQDPVGPSPLDAAGAGHRGSAAIAAFYDAVIAPNESITFDIDSSYLCGEEVADVGVIRTVLPGGRHVAVVHGDTPIAPTRRGRSRRYAHSGSTTRRKSQRPEPGSAGSNRCQ